MVFSSSFERPAVAEDELLSEFYWRQLDAHAGRVLLLDDPSGRQWTGAQMKQHCARLAGFLVGRALAPAEPQPPGEQPQPRQPRALILHTNDDHTQLVALAAILAGAGVCYAWPDDPEHEHRHLLVSLRPRVVFVGRQLRARVSNILADLGLAKLSSLVVMDDLVDDLVEPERLPRCFGYHRHLVAYAGPPLARPVRALPADPAYILFTSGSTGQPKPVARSLANSLHVCHSLDTAPELWQLPEGAVFAGHLPLDHGTGTFSLKMTLARGLKLVIQPGYDEAALLAAIERHSITDCMLGSALLHNMMSGLLGVSGAAAAAAGSDHEVVGANGELEKVVKSVTVVNGSNCDAAAACHASSKNQEAPKKANLSSLRNLIAIGSPISSHELACQFMDAFPQVSVRQAFGMTECGFLSMVPREESRDPQAGVGRLLPGVEVKLVEPETGLEVHELHRQGELYVRAPTVSPGYLASGPDEALAKLSRELFQADGFYRSNDLAMMVAPDRLRICGRRHEILCLGDGWKVLPAEIEQVLARHPAVLEVSVVGVAHPQLPGCHAPRAFVVARPGAEVAAEELQRFASAHLSGPKQLEGGVRFVERMPRVTLGKVDKAALRLLD